ncbi:bactofilin family protein [Cecembia lonarensis]|uniref:Polymer-forming cytoskeletal n=1 Tax=Cecembia lonarensis (strain CCUG 58316 / KCTC 22772 / LW9) TaxID=1225176 RepID=K1L8D4_CECL9|nr:polymer-forming cytoskeletal protein [Cecembia lonarensis]EKB48407.1 Polymer-forming cytoskeletal [Cecembia lonarensis LW9]
MFNKAEEKKSVVDMVNSSNVISKETNIKGDIVAQGNIRIEGAVEGSVKSKSKIVIGESAAIKGNLSSAEAEISGKVDGQVVCSDVLYLKKSAMVTGDIVTNKLVVENGATFNGRCQMGAEVNKSSKSPKVDELKKELASG